MGEMAEIPVVLDEQVQLRANSLAKALGNEDELGIVVRAHIHIEHELREFVTLAAPNPEALKFSEMDFEGTVRLALVLGLDPELKPPLNAAGSLRNKFSHRLEMKLGEQEVNNLFAALTPDKKKTMQQTYNTIMEKRHGRKLHDAPVRDRIEMFFIMLFSQLIGEM
jgi:hypothetical protein